MIRLVLKGVPPSLNRFAGRKNEHEYRAEKEKWTRAVYYTAKANKDRPTEPFEKADVEILYYFPDKRRRDPDNYGGKFLLDGLTKAGIIADDSMEHIRLHIGGAADRKEPRTVITVREAENG